MDTITYNPNSILCSVKHYLGNIATDDTLFDDELINDINSAISELFILGVCPGETPFVISDDSDLWSDYLGEGYEEQLGHAQKFINCNVKLAFDPPASPTLIENLQSQMKKAGSYLKWLNE